MRFEKGQDKKKLPEGFHSVLSARLRLSDGLSIHMCHMDLAQFLEVHKITTDKGITGDPGYYTVLRGTNELMITPAPTKRVEIELHCTIHKRL